MHLHYRNVNDALHSIIQYFQAGLERSYNGVRLRESRNGDTLYLSEPCTITYRNPLERVLFNPARNANPFFHLMEALWMLAGRNDLATVKWYNSHYDAFSDDGVTIHGAYGWRWRRFFALDQIDLIIKSLKRDLSNRRLVLQHWTVSDLERQYTHPSCRDVPCNTQVLFNVRRVPREGGYDDYLDMTVFNRSNDLIWGTLGANYVHFSLLQEYIALDTNLLVGYYHQVSNNQHIYLGEPHKDDPTASDELKADCNRLGCTKVFDKWYTPTQSNHWNPEPWLAGFRTDYNTIPVEQPPLTEDRSKPLLPEVSIDDKHFRPRRYVPLYWGTSREMFDTMLQRFMSPEAHGPSPMLLQRTFSDCDFLTKVAEPMRLAWQHAKAKFYLKAKIIAGMIAAPDWRTACIEWLQRAEQRHLDKTPTNTVS